MVGLTGVVIFCCINSLMDGVIDGVGSCNGLLVYTDRGVEGGGRDSGIRGSAVCGRLAHCAGASLIPGGGAT